MFKNITEEIKWLQKRMEMNPQSILFARLAERYLQMEEYDQAIDICKTGLEEHPEYTNAHLVIAKCYMKKNDFEQADQEFRRLLSIQSNHLTAHKLYGDLMTHTGWANSAETSYEKILEIDPLETHMKEPLENFIFEVQRSAEPGVNIEPVTEAESDNQESVDELFGATAEDSEETIGSLFQDDVESDMLTTDLDPKVAEEIKDKDPDEYRLADETVDALFANDTQEIDTDMSDMMGSMGTDEEITESVFQDAMDDQDQQVDDIFSQEMSGLKEEHTEQFFGDESDVQSKLAKELEKQEPTEFDDQVQIDNVSMDNLQPSTDDIFGGTQEKSIFPMAESEIDDDMELFSPTSEEPDTRDIFPEQEEPDLEPQTAEPEVTESFKQPDWESEPETTVQDDEPKIATDSVRAEKDKYSDILDGIFSQDVEDEERKETETRSKLEQVISEAEETTELDESYNFDEMQVDDDLTENAFFDTFDDSDEDYTSPENLILSQADEAEKIPEQETLQEQSEEPHIPDGFMVFEEDSQTSIEPGTVHVQEPDNELEDDEEQFSDFLAGLGDPKEFKDEVVNEYEQESEKTFVESDSDDAPTAEFISEPVPHDTEKESPVEQQNDEEKPKEKFVTPTLGEIYAAQGQYAKAINVFEMLLEKNPDNEWYHSKLDYLRKKLEESE